MSDGSKIEWTEATWNVATGCTKVSDGCLHCYIERTPPFRMAHRGFDKEGIGGSTGVVLHDERLHQPFHWRKPRRIFVCSLADLFHDSVPDLFIAKVWATMARTPQHTYQVLTKRPARMRSLLSSHDFTLAVEAVCGHRDWSWPLPNVWAGVSAESQKWADIRIPHLLDTPAAVRWVSAEPLLEPIDFDRWLHHDVAVRTEVGARCYCGAWMNADGDCPTGRLGWVVCGGESGLGARLCDPDWLERIVADCEDASVPVLVKQLGTVTGGRKHHDIGTFPSTLRVREYPTEVTA